MLGPFRSSGARILDVGSGKEVRFFGGTIPGTASPLAVPVGLDRVSIRLLLATIRRLPRPAGYLPFLRIPFSVAAINENPIVLDGLDANPDLTRKGCRYQDLMKRFCAEAYLAGFYVIPVAQFSETGDGRQDSGLPWVRDYKAEISKWKKSLAWWAKAKRLNRWMPIPAVELWNEPGSTNLDDPQQRVTWGSGDPSRDWRAIGTAGGEAMLHENPDLAPIFGGIQADPRAHLVPDDPSKVVPTWPSANLIGVRDAPVELPNVWYGPHHYAFYHEPWDEGSPEQVFKKTMAVIKETWGFIAEEGIAPLVVAEIGGPAEPLSPNLQAVFSFISQHRLSAGLYPITGEQPPANGRLPGTRDYFGALYPDELTPVQGSTYSQAVHLIDQYKTIQLPQMTAGNGIGSLGS
jgi:hypothetical protein